MAKWTRNEKGEVVPVNEAAKIEHAAYLKHSGENPIAPTVEAKKIEGFKEEIAQAVLAAIKNDEKTGEANA